MENSAPNDFRPEKIKEAKRKIEADLNKDPEAIGAVIKRLLPKVLNGVPCWHCNGEGKCNCSLCSLSSQKRPCRICFGKGKLSIDGSPLISEEEFFLDSQI